MFVIDYWILFLIEMHSQMEKMQFLYKDDTDSKTCNKSYKIF